MRQNALRLLVLGLLVVAVSACGGNGGDEAGGEGHLAFGYEGDVGPDRWAGLSDDNKACGTGHSQSPIDLTAAAIGEPATLDFAYGTTDLSVLNNGHAVQVPYDSGSALVVDDHRYELAQFHAHVASEHTVDGVAYPLELHLVHSDDDGNLAVVGVLVEAGEEHSELAKVAGSIPAASSEEPTDVDGVSFDASMLLPSDRTFYQYDGSLTTPPCTEGVAWRVFAEPIEMSQAQIDAFADVFHANARPVQPLGTRALISHPGS